jgi:type II secretion system (T2SS) protein M
MRAAWVAVFALALAGYGVIVSPSERTVRSLTRQSQDLYELANRNEAVLTQRASLVRLRDRVRRDLDELTSENTPAKASLAFIELLDREEKKRDVSVGTFAPEETASSGDTQRISLSLRGSYENVLPFLSDLTRNRPLAEVESAELQRPADGSDGSQIDGQVRLTLYHTPAGFIHTVHTEVRQHDTTAHD